jgi:hypothetical protein
MKYALNFLGIRVRNLEDLTKLIEPPLRESFEGHYGLGSKEVETSIKKFRYRSYARWSQEFVQKCSWLYLQIACDNRKRIKADYFFVSLRKI